MGHAFKLLVVVALSTICCFDRRTSASISTRSIVIGESSCETLPSSIHINKEVNNEHGQLVRTCEADLAVNKCEGTCQSQLQPSVVKQSGFLKECQCCRETHLRERDVVLTQCYDTEGQQLVGELGQLTVRLKEPAACRCFKCGNE